MRVTEGVIDPMEERLELIADDLVARFHECTSVKARALVKSVAAQFEGAPIQDYVGVLTAKICRDRLHPPSSDDQRPAGRFKHNRAFDGHSARIAARWIVALVAVAHGSIHLLGAAKGFGWADGATSSEPISAGFGAVWLSASVVTIVTGSLLLARVRWWWIVGAISIVVSQAVIVTSWADAKAGTLPNLVLLIAVIYGWASQGRHGARAEYRRRAGRALAAPCRTDPVTEADLARLPAEVAAYVRRSGAVGRPHVRSLHANFRGRIRSGPTKPWMTFVGEQVNVYGPDPARFFLMDAELFGLPVEVLHVFAAGGATMRVRALSLFTMVDASGPEMDRGETVTVFNDLCVLAPGALVDAPVTWHAIDDHRVRGTYTNGLNTVTAELTFNDDHELVDFVSDDRSAVSTDGKSFTPQRWSTPIGGYSELGPWHLGTSGEGRWLAPAHEFTYIEYELDHVAYNAADLVSEPECEIGDIPRRTIPSRQFSSVPPGVEATSPGCARVPGRATTPD